MKRTILFALTIFLAISIPLFSGCQPQRQQTGVYHDTGGRAYYYNAENGQAYYLDPNGQPTTVVVPATAVPQQNGRPYYGDPARRETGRGSNETLQGSGTPQSPNSTQRVPTVPDARRPSPNQAIPQSRVPTVPSVRTTPTYSAPRVSTVPSAPPRTSTVPSSRRP